MRPLYTAGKKKIKDNIIIIINYVFYASDDVREDPQGPRGNVVKALRRLSIFVIFTSGSKYKIKIFFLFFFFTSFRKNNVVKQT